MQRLCLLFIVLCIDNVPAKKDGPSGPHTVLVVEDDPATRQRLAQAVEVHPALRLVGASETFSQGQAALGEQRPAVLLTDIELPDGSGIDLIRAARAHGTTQSMVITVFEDEAVVVRAIEAGASGYLLKDESMEQVADSILRLIDGGSPISSRIARFLLRQFRATRDEVASAQSDDASEIPPLRVHLTARESEVLELIAKGFTFPEISELLAISTHTVTAHVRHIYDKLEVNSRGEAVYEAVSQGILKLGQ